MYPARVWFISANRSHESQHRCSISDRSHLKTTHALCCLLKAWPEISTKRTPRGRLQWSVYVGLGYYASECYISSVGHVDALGTSKSCPKGKRFSCRFEHSYPSEETEYKLCTRKRDENAATRYFSMATVVILLRRIFCFGASRFAIVCV